MSQLSTASGTSFRGLFPHQKKLISSRGPDPENRSAVENFAISDGVLIWVVGLNSASAVSQTLLSLPQTVRKRINDVCCVNPRQKGPFRWRLFTTHASVRVDGKRIDISHGSERPRDGFLVYRLKQQRNALFTMLNGAKTNDGFPYVSIRGKKVVLLGDFSGLPGVLLLGLEKIFLVSAAKEVNFVQAVSLDA